MGSLEKRWIKRVQEGDKQAFERLFIKYYASLVNFAYSYVRCSHRAEGVVQEVFADCWQRREQLDPSQNIKTFLFQSVKYQSLDILKHKEVQNRYKDKLMSKKEPERQPEVQVNSADKTFVQAVQEAIEELPDRAKKVYVLHRREGLTYKEIAQVMEISPKTVESQMSRALKLLRNRLDKFVSA